MIFKKIVNNKLILFFSLLGILFSVSLAEAVQEKVENGVSANLSISETAAVDALIAQYFDYLFTGNIVGLKNISTGELSLQLERLGTNPGYSEFLRKQYLNAEYEIVDYRLSASKQLMVTVKVIKENSTGSAFLIYIDSADRNGGSGQQMKIENAEKL